MIFRILVLSFYRKGKSWTVQLEMFRNLFVFYSENFIREFIDSFFDRDSLSDGFSDREISCIYYDSIDVEWF